MSEAAIPTTNPTRVALYLRCSVQGDDGSASRSAQEQTLRTFTAAEWADGAEIVGVFADEGPGATSQSRPPELERLVSLVEAGEINVVVVARLDRLTRSVQVLVELLALLEGFSVRVVTEEDRFDTATAVGKFSVRLMGMLEQSEREQRSERIKAAKAEKAKRHRTK